MAGLTGFLCELASGWLWHAVSREWRGPWGTREPRILEHGSSWPEPTSAAPPVPLRLLFSGNCPFVSLSHVPRDSLFLLSEMLCVAEVKIFCNF